MSEIIWHEINMISNTAPAPYVATASSQYNTGTYGVFNMYSISPHSEWWLSASVTVGYSQIDFGSLREITHFKIRSSSRTNAYYNPKEFSISGSNDGVNFETINNYTNVAPSKNSEEKIFELAERVKYRYMRINTLSSNGNYIMISNLTYGYVPVVKNIILKNPSTNQHYSLADKTLIPLPDTSTKNMILHGIEAGVEIKLDEPFTTIRHITENDDGTQEVVDEEVEPFSVYDYISENPQAIMYTETVDDIAITTSTNPYTLYDEFGDEVEILYYTDDETVTEVNLEITANWSPLDELEGDFEIVTWTDEPADTATREFSIEGLHTPAFVPMQNWIDVANLVGISVAGVTDTFAPFAIQKKNDEKLYSYYQGYFFPVTIDAVNLHNYGMTPAMVNAITRTEWLDFLDGETELRFHFYFSNRSIGTRSKSATLDVVHQIGKIQVLREITQSTPSADKIELEASVYSMEGRLEELERINLNNLLELELRTAILLKMPMIQSGQLIIETFDDNSYEMYEEIDQLIEVPSTGVDENGNPLPPTWETIKVPKPTSYDPLTRSYKGDFKVAIPIIDLGDATEMILQHAGTKGLIMRLTDGVNSIISTNLYDEVIDVSILDVSKLTLQATGFGDDEFKGITYTWS